ncbi:MAG: CDP-glycerol glycerophosphotransferase family protein [Streptococcus orisratti]|uniref:CDP-glycerol glycerophosphotransferase family protein n=1 Tax=Streptococcus orisratti TaxID=114652 RepID=UPI0023565049|nr:CDP-glycerol glycerophosphotransferase family protein [Streptococcus orisratti]MCI7678040.1 CDP-glycerol glycerophosphotransferase family protein [Streptococcus orisratti]
MKEYIKQFELIVKKLIILPSYFIKLNPKKIVVSNFNGKGYGDNPKYIVRSLLDLNEGYDIVWMLEDLSCYLPDSVRKVKIGSIKSFYEMATAKVWIDNIRTTWRPWKRKGQVYLQTWHGSFGPKLVERDAVDALSPEYVMKAKKDGEICDAIIASNYFQVMQYKNSFWLNKDTKILRFGTPRNDVLFTKKNIDIDYIKDFLGIPQDAKVILYMPTFRDDFSTKGYLFNFEKTVAEFEKRFKENFVIIVRFHPNVQQKHSKLIMFSKKVINGSLYEDSQELLLITDYLVSDYSSAPFDFMLLNKPVFLYMPDYIEYKAKRGMLDIFASLPFSKSYSEEQFFENIRNFDETEYIIKINCFKKDFQTYEDGNAAVSIANWIDKKINLDS